MKREDKKLIRIYKQCINVTEFNPNTKRFRNNLRDKISMIKGS